MISGRKIKLKQDIEQAQKILDANKIQDNIDINDIIYVLEDNDDIIGVCGIEKNSDYGVLKYLVISNINRGNNFGDSLLRATLNCCLRYGIYNVIYPEINDYIFKFGFDKVDSNNVSDKLNTTFNKEILLCDIENFFSKGCSCKG